MNITFTPVQTLKEKPTTADVLGFGKVFTDYMLVLPYYDGKWQTAQIRPYENLSLSPAAMCLHYGQTVFEGMKAYRTKSGEITLFRPEENFKRLNSSNERLCIPQLPVETAMECLTELLKVEADWIPSFEGASLYIRPFIIATDPFLGVRPGDEYMFIIILSPSGAYYSSGINPVSICVEDNYVRAVNGGMGHTKTGGNYAASLAGQEKAHSVGCAQTLWLDGVERKYIEEVGSMNIFFVIDGEVITPALSGSILPGITRKSVIELCKSFGLTVTERRIAIDEVVTAHNEGRLNEIFGTGTAAVISPVGEIIVSGQKYTVNDGKIGDVSQKLYDKLTAIQFGEVSDEFGWVTKLNK